MQRIFRIKNQPNYTVVNNELIKDKRLSLDSRGLLVLILSHPPDFSINISYLQSICKEGRNTLIRMLTELQLNGYAVKSVRRSVRGNITNVEWFFYEKPQK